MRELLEKNTFGGTRAAESLVRIINESQDKGWARSVSKLFANYSMGIHEIHRGIKNKGFRDSLISLWNQHASEKIERSDLPDKIRSYLNNIEKTLCKKIRRGDFDEQLQ